MSYGTPGKKDHSGASAEAGEKSEGRRLSQVVKIDSFGIVCSLVRFIHFHHFVCGQLFTEPSCSGGLTECGCGVDVRMPLEQVRGGEGHTRPPDATLRQREHAGKGISIARKTVSRVHPMTH